MMLSQDPPNKIIAGKAERREALIYNFRILIVLPSYRHNSSFDKSQIGFLYFRNHDSLPGRQICIQKPRGGAFRRKWGRL